MTPETRAKCGKPLPPGAGRHYLRITRAAKILGLIVTGAFTIASIVFIVGIIEWTLSSNAELKKDAGRTLFAAIGMAVAGLVVDLFIGVALAVRDMALNSFDR